MNEMAVKTSARLMGGTTTQGTRISASLHAEQLVEDGSLAYLAPEALTSGADGGYAPDIFSLGAIAYLLFTGKPPAASQAELQEKLRVTSGLDIKESLDGAVDALADNRGELLFELRGATQRQFALYRVLRGQADKLFVSGPGGIAPPPSPAVFQPAARRGK